MTFQPDTRQQPESPQCRKGGNIYLNHDFRAGRCVQCGIPAPKQPSLKPK